MANDFTIRAVNNWRATMHAEYSHALRVSMDVWGREADQATKHMLILMAQSARAMTPQAPARRKVQQDGSGRYVEKYNKAGELVKRYQWQFSQPGARGTWEGAQKIGNRGLAKRSWLWGLAKGKPIAGTSEVGRIQSGARVVGWQKINRLDYIDAIMPAGYQQAADQKAISKLMKQAEMKMVRAYERSIGR
jgi:hypothetical protein